MAFSATIAALVLLAAPTWAAGTGQTVRPGRWKLVAGDDFDPRAPTVLCLARHVVNVGRLAKTCPIKTAFDGHRAVVDGACTTHGAQMTIHGVATGDFQTDYQADLTISIAPGRGAPTQTLRSHGEYRYVGPCAPGETPDDQ